MKKIVLFVLAVVAFPILVKAQQNVVVVLDDSSSMGAVMSNRQSRMSNAKSALKNVIARLPDDTNLGIVLLNQDPHWVVPFGRLEKGRTIAIVNQLSENGGTPLGYYMKEGADALLSYRENSHYGEYKLLILTDGEAGDEGLVEKYLPDILSRGITVDVIGLDMESQHSLATKVNHYRSAENSNQLETAIKATFAEINQKDSSSEDFDLIAGLPDGMAPQLLDALTTGGNHPIGTKPVSFQSSSTSSNGSGIFSNCIIALVSGLLIFFIFIVGIGIVAKC